MYEIVNFGSKMSQIGMTSLKDNPLYTFGKHVNEELRKKVCESQQIYPVQGEWILLLKLDWVDPPPTTSTSWSKNKIKK